MKRFTPNWIRRTIAVAGIAALSPLLSGCPMGPTTYIVRIQNLSAQPIGRVAAVTHSNTLVIWRAGNAAGTGLAELAEAGNPDAFAAEADANGLVTNAVTTDVPLTAQGRSVARFGDYIISPANPGPPLVDNIQFEITGDPFDVLSIAGALLATNDGFFGVQNLSLPTASEGARRYFALAYDAGVEENTELALHLNPEGSILGVDDVGSDIPNGTSPSAPGSVITLHPGIDGTVGDLTQASAWREPIVQIIVSVKTE